MIELPQHPAQYINFTLCRLSPGLRDIEAALRSKYALLAIRLRTCIGRLGLRLGIHHGIECASEFIRRKNVFQVHGVKLNAITLFNFGSAKFFDSLIQAHSSRRIKPWIPRRS